jgi:hypothetical protein
MREEQKDKTSSAKNAAVGLLGKLLGSEKPDKGKKK